MLESGVATQTPSAASPIDALRGMDNMPEHKRKILDELEEVIEEGASDGFTRPGSRRGRLPGRKQGDNQGQNKPGKNRLHAGRIPNWWGRRFVLLVLMMGWLFCEEQSFNP